MVLHKKLLALSYFVLLTLMLSCENKTPLKANDLKKGTFKILADENYDETIFIRKENFQIETYGNKTDTLLIEWKSNFEYELKMLHPKTKLDNEPIKVKVTKIHSGGYDFSAVIGYSKFKQKGTVIKIN